MTTIPSPPIALPRPRPLPGEDFFRNLAHKHLDRVFGVAPVIPFDDHSRFILFSDCHRGDGSNVDAFAANKTLFRQVLNDYYEQGYSYIEVGDGDELWQNRLFRSIRQAHAPIFDLLHRFYDADRLHIIFGNHDFQGGEPNGIWKDGLPTHEGIILEHAKTGQQLFVVHGHQADWTSNNLFIFSKFVVRLLWRQMRRLGVAKVNVEWINPLHRTPNEGKLVQRIEDRLSSWAARQHQTIVCGHTHIPHLPVRGMPAYLNTGHCMAPGIVTGLEIRDGQVWPVKWMARGDRGRERHLWTTPRLLTDLTG
ncbi:MAG: metallophosphoesterase family protein [Chloroflexi bacterium]|nr:metallophosphoesterase family protein [Chloroflexota bacterium]MBP8059539.1 metallophosphoesterase family protein [Chloroflexota bacterium]